MNLLKPLIKAGKPAAKVVVKDKPFFSAVDKAALELARTKGTGKEFMTELKKVPGVKPAEIQHRKLEKIEALPKMEKADFLKQLEENPPAAVRESVKIQNTPENLEKLANENNFDRYFDELSDEDKEMIWNQTATYDQYRLPGGSNYREILLQMPTFGGRDLEDLMSLEAAERRGGIGTRYGEENLARLRKKRDEMGEAYNSPHWKADQNVLAHMRVQDRTGPNGEKILHVEEIQSDWHQQGRQKGYKEKYEPKIKEVTGRTMSVADLINEYGDEGRKWLDTQNSINQDLKLPPFDESTSVNVLYHNGEPQIVSEASKRPLNEMIESQQKAVDKMQRESEMMHSNSQKNKVPDAPFKKNWHELAMKRLINYAAENGYDSIAITPGIEQAKRYDLSKHIDAVEWNPENGRLYAKKKDGTDFEKMADGVTQENLADYIGKDAAEKLLAQPFAGSYKQLSGLDLQTGGEGMMGFYDKMLPDYLNSFGKKYGSQVELGGYKLPGDPSLRGEASERLGLAGQRFADMTPEEIEAFNARLDEANAKQLHHFKITPEMREEVTSQGIPLYQKIGVPLGTGAAGAEMEMPQPAQETEEPAYAAGGAVDNTTPDMSDGGQIIQGDAFKRGGKVHLTDNTDAMFMDLHDKMFKRK